MAQQLEELNNGHLVEPSAVVLNRSTPSPFLLKPMRASVADDVLPEAFHLIMQTNQVRFENRGMLLVSGLQPARGVTYLSCGATELREVSNGMLAMSVCTDQRYGEKSVHVHPEQCHERQEMSDMH